LPAMTFFLKVASRLLKSSVRRFFRSYALRD